MSERPDSLAELEQLLRSLKRRIPRYPLELSILSRFAVHVEKRNVELCTRILKPQALTYVSYQALVIAFASGDAGITPTELARATGERATNVTHIADDLLRRELITRTRDAQDRRRVVLKLTAAGESLLAQVQPKIWAVWTRRYKGFSAAERATLEELLRRQFSNLEDGDSL